MRCRYCGSTSLHADKQHKTFSTGKAVAGAVVFGPSGAIAGMIGKDQEGYRCGVCGAFMDAPMDLLTEHSIDSAISDAEAGRGTSKFQYYQKQYPNIRATIPARATNITEQISLPVLGHGAIKDTAPKQVSTVKHMYRNLHWVKGCPIYVEKIIIHNTNAGDTLSLEAWNQGEMTIRSAYFQATIYDDTGDEIGKCQCVYQGLSIAPGQCLPIEKQFPLQSDLAYRVKLTCEKIALSNDSVWRASSGIDEVTLPVQPELEEMGFPRLKYVRWHVHEVSKLEADSPLYLPVESKDYWQCICGQPVIMNCTCPRCGASIEKLNSLLSQENLQKMQQNTVKAIAAKRAKATMSLYEQAVHQETESQYQQALTLQYQDTEESLNQAIALYNAIPNYKDSAQRAIDCQERIPALTEELRQKRIEEETAAEKKRIAEAAAKKRSKTIAIFSGIAIVLIIAITIVITKVVMPLNKYKNAEKLLAAGDYDGAAIAFEELGDYKDSTEQVADIPYRQAIALMDSGKYDEAIELFRELDNYKDSENRIIDCENLRSEAIQLEAYQSACDLMEQGEYTNAIAAFEDLGEYKDSPSQILACEEALRKSDYNKALQFYRDTDYLNAIALFRKLGEYEDCIALSEEIESSMLSGISIGDVVCFGCYDNRPISWRVLDIQNGSALIRSTECLFESQYNSRTSNMVTWEISSLRKFLNSEFLEVAFSQAEQQFIVTTTLSNEYHTTKLNLDPTINIGGNSTMDQIFILSRDELFQYCNVREGLVSSSYRSDAGYENGVSGSAWLRTPDVEMENVRVGIWVEGAQVVYEDGSFGDVGNTILVTENRDVVPAMRIDISGLIET